MSVTGSDGYAKPNVLVLAALPTGVQKIKIFLFAYSDQYAAFKGNSSPKVKGRGKNSSKTLPPFNLNIPTHAMRGCCFM